MLNFPMDADPHDAVGRLEERINQLASTIESCRKFIFAGRIAMAGGAAVLAAMLAGIMRADLLWMAGGMAAILAGIVVFGANSSTAKEAAKDLAAAKAARSALIDQIELRDVTLAPTLH
jgi:hypothetical protein